MQDRTGNDAFRYDAFISYEPALPDASIARHLHDSLESYRVPGSLVRQGTPSHLRGVFLDLEEGGSEEALRGSRFLIVICSPRTLHSEKVERRILAFRALGRGEQILALLIEGEPEESFPLLLREVRRTVSDPSGTREVVEEVEPLAADIRAPSQKQSLRLLKTERLRLIAPVLGRRFDDLKQRRRERLIRYWTMVASVGIVASTIFTGVSLHQWRNAAEQERVAAEQQRQAEAAYLKLTRELPERFKEVPEALPVIKRVLEENADTLEKIRREQEDPQKVLEELLATADRPSSISDLAGSSRSANPR